jgi:hypothetical protein
VQRRITQFPLLVYTDTGSGATMAVRLSISYLDEDKVLFVPRNNIDFAEATMEIAFDFPQSLFGKKVAGYLLRP